MSKHIDANLVPNQYQIHEKDGERFILAQPNGEKIIVHEKPSIIKIAAVATVAAAILICGLFVWLEHVPRH